MRLLEVYLDLTEAGVAVTVKATQSDEVEVLSLTPNGEMEFPAQMFELIAEKIRNNKLDDLFE